METENDCIKNYNIAVKKRGDDITFLRRIVRGPADDSYGIEVAKLAGIPDSVVARAKEILRQTEAEGGALPPSRAAVPQGDDGQLSLMAAADGAVVRRLREVDVNTLTPIEAMQLLYELHKEAGEE